MWVDRTDLCGEHWVAYVQQWMSIICNDDDDNDFILQRYLLDIHIFSLLTCYTSAISR